MYTKLATQLIDDVVIRWFFKLMKYHQIVGHQLFYKYKLWYCEKQIFAQPTVVIASSSQRFLKR